VPIVAFEQMDPPARVEREDLNGGQAATLARAGRNPEPLRRATGEENETEHGGERRHGQKQLHR